MAGSYLAKGMNLALKCSIIILTFTLPFRVIVEHSRGTSSGYGGRRYDRSGGGGGGGGGDRYGGGGGGGRDRGGGRGYVK